MSDYKLVMIISDMPHLPGVRYVHAWLVFCTFLKNAEVKNSWLSFGVRFKSMCFVLIQNLFPVSGQVIKVVHTTPTKPQLVTSSINNQGAVKAIFKAPTQDGNQVCFFLYKINFRYKDFFFKEVIHSRQAVYPSHLLFKCTSANKQTKYKYS